MVKVDDFTLMVANDERDLGYVGYSSSRYTMRLFHKMIPLAFPAVAIMDRMIMVPQGIQSAFNQPTKFSWFPKPLDLDGMLLVDFQHLEAVHEAARQAGIRLKTEIAKLCRRHMRVNRLREPDFHALSQLLKIDVNFLEKYRNEMLTSMVKLIPRIVSGTAQIHKTSRVTLEIQNESESVPGRFLIKVEAPLGTLEKPVVAILDFSAGAARTQSIQFEVSPQTLPYCPLKVTFELIEMDEQYQIPVILDVSS
jgi:hypothetical protein